MSPATRSCERAAGFTGPDGCRVIPDADAVEGSSGARPPAWIWSRRTEMDELLRIAQTVAAFATAGYYLIASLLLWKRRRGP